MAKPDRPTGSGAPEPTSYSVQMLMEVAARAERGLHRLMRIGLVDRRDDGFVLTERGRAIAEEMYREARKSGTIAPQEPVEKALRTVVVMAILKAAEPDVLPAQEIVECAGVLIAMLKPADAEK